jgi:hypothetical protein
MKMPFGRHVGIEVADVPAGYLRWLRDNCELYGELADEVDEALAVREKSRSQSRRESRVNVHALDAEAADAELLLEVINRGYRAAALAHHPDQGGDPTVMQRLNLMVARLRARLQPAQRKRV